MKHDREMEKALDNLMKMMEEGPKERAEAQQEGKSEDGGRT